MTNTQKVTAELAELSRPVLYAHRARLTADMSTCRSRPQPSPATLTNLRTFARRLGRVRAELRSRPAGVRLLCPSEQALYHLTVAANRATGNVLRTRPAQSNLSAYDRGTRDALQVAIRTIRTQASAPARPLRNFVASAGGL
jgi:hypothetical protein